SVTPCYRRPDGETQGANRPAHPSDPIRFLDCTNRWSSRPPQDGKRVSSAPPWIDVCQVNDVFNAVPPIFPRLAKFLLYCGPILNRRLRAPEARHGAERRLNSVKILAGRLRQ